MPYKKENKFPTTPETAKAAADMKKSDVKSLHLQNIRVYLKKCTKETDKDQKQIDAKTKKSESNKETSLNEKDSGS